MSYLKYHFSEMVWWEIQRAEKYCRCGRLQENIDLVYASVDDEYKIYISISRRSQQVELNEITTWRILRLC